MFVNMSLSCLPAYLEALGLCGCSYANVTADDVCGLVDELFDMGVLIDRLRGEEWDSESLLKCPVNPAGCGCGQSIASRQSPLILLCCIMGLVMCSLCVYGF